MPKLLQNVCLYGKIINIFFFVFKGAMFMACVSVRVIIQLLKLVDYLQYRRTHHSLTYTKPLSLWILQRRYFGRQ